jgi:antirestriction protein ArdC
MSTAPSTGGVSLYQTITDKIVAAIEAGAGAFVMPWHVGASTGRPTNALTRNAYQGVNVISLWASAMLAGFETGYWATFRQWKTAGAQVRRGERGTATLFYKSLDGDRVETEDDVARRFVARASYVFNASQVDGWTAPEAAQKAEATVIETAEAFVARAGADIRHGALMACYLPQSDWIEMPDRNRFCGTYTSSATESYYAVLLHELVHWTGAAHRLDRTIDGRFGSSTYAVEELVAELGAAFLCADLGIANEPRLDHAAYVQSWLKVLKSDSKALFVAAKEASRAVDFLHSLCP